MLFFSICGLSLCVPLSPSPPPSFLFKAREVESEMLSSSREHHNINNNNNGAAAFGLRRPAEEEAMLAFANAIYGRKKEEEDKEVRQTHL